eukprot:GDKH01004039.1.p1 GENE.GDKH01004039.1~~GDKH01004039.1.p1  ORF type:complete len:52 (+),score=7.21 GDKH01004039.1:179-334(+)
MDGGREDEVPFTTSIRAAWSRATAIGGDNGRSGSGRWRVDAIHRWLVEPVA